MTNKNTEKEKLNRDEIITAVAHLIAEQGLENITMRNIAKHVGCSVGTLPHYFEGKDDIVIAALNWSSERIFNRLPSMDDNEIHLASLYPLISASMPTDKQADIEWRVRLCLWDYAVTDDEMKLSVNAAGSYAQELLTSLILHLQNLQEIRADLDAEVCAMTFYQMCSGAGFSMLHQDFEHRDKQLKPLFSYIESIKA